MKKTAIAKTGAVSAMIMAALIIAAAAAGGAASSGCGNTQTTVMTAAQVTNVGGSVPTSPAASGSEKIPHNANAAADGAQLLPPSAGEEVAVFETTKGVIKMRLFPEQCPITVDNFKNLINSGYYNNVIFHRVIDGFMIQSGDPEGTGRGGDAFGGGTIADEFSENLYNFRGALSMANTGAPNSGGSQFFIVQSKQSDVGTDILKSCGYSDWAAEKYGEIGGRPTLDGVYNQRLAPSYNGHTVFGQVYEGMDVVDAIAAVTTDINDRPVEDITITSAYLTKA